MKIKIGSGKQATTSLKASQFSSLNVSMIKMGKNTSKHTKSSTSHTLSSFHIGLSKQKNEKIKKSLLSSKNNKIITCKQKQSLSSLRLKKPNNKSKQKKSLDFEFENYNKFQQKQNDGGISYRQYCLVQNSFIPITTTYQHKKIDQILKSTADSTPLYQDIHHNITTRKVFPFKLKQSMKSIFQQQSITQNQHSISNCKQINKKQTVIAKASPIYEQIGIQYSQRYPIQIQQLSKVLNKQKLSKVVQIDIQTQQILMINSSKQTKNQQISPLKVKQQEQQQIQQNQSSLQPLQQKKQQSLADLLLKLQYKHLSNEKSFQQLSKMQKQHYSCLLTQLITKLTLTTSPRESPKTYKTKQKIHLQQVNFTPLQQIKIKYQRLQIQIYKRQCYQTNLMQRPFNPEQSEQSVDTSLLAISTFLFNFFCYLELNYSEEFLNMIKKQYGLSYKLEYQKLTRAIKTNMKPLKVLDECLFQDFCDQTLNQVSLYEKIHLKAVFDCINDLLDTYRPFYNHYGQPFPWSFKMYHNICEYAFDQDSLQIIFGQIKQTLQTDVSNLCGIIIDEKYHIGNNQKTLLKMKREEKQNKFIQNWLNQNTHQTKAIESQATKVLFDVSEIIYNQLLLEILNEKTLLKQNDDFQFIE